MIPLYNFSRLLCASLSAKSPPVPILKQFNKPSRQGLPIAWLITVDRRRDSIIRSCLSLRRQRFSPRDFVASFGLCRRSRRRHRGPPAARYVAWHRGAGNGPRSTAFHLATPCGGRRGFVPVQDGWERAVGGCASRQIAGGSECQSMILSRN